MLKDIHDVQSALQGRQPLQLVIDFQVTFRFEEISVKLMSNIGIYAGKKELWRGLTESIVSDPIVKKLAEQTQATLLSISLDKDASTLTIVFDSELMLVAYPDDDFESWQLERLDGSPIAICGPGGEISWWDVA